MGKIDPKVDEAIQTLNMKDGPTRRISLRSRHDEIDVSAIARKRGGGGHPQAAGFSSEEPVERIIEFLRREFATVHGSGADPEGA